MKTSKKHGFLLRLVACIVALTMLFSAVAVPFASAASDTPTRITIRQQRENDSPKLTNLMIGQTDIADYLFSGTTKLVNLLGKGDPVSLSLFNGFLGAFKSFYGDMTTTAQPTTADILNMLDQLRDELKLHHDAEMQLLKYGLTLDKLQSFATHLNSAVAHNRFGLKYISLYSNPDMDQYDVIIRETIGREGLLNTFSELSTDLTLGAIALHGIPALEQYLIGAASCEENGFNYDNVYDDAMLFNQMTMEQYCLLYTVILTGYLARYEQLSLQAAEGMISERTLKTEQAAVVAAMQEYTAMAKEVADKYLTCCKKLETMHIADVTIDGVTTPKCSLADAWITALLSGKEATVTLTRNVDMEDLGSDAIEFERSEYFKDGALFLENHTAKITLDLNGFNLLGVDDYTVIVSNAVFNVINSSDFSGILCGLYAQNASLTLKNVTILDSSDYGIYAQYGTLTMDSCLIQGAAKTGIFSYHGKVSLTDCTIAECGSSDILGGGIYADGSGLTVTQCFITDCSAKCGGGIYTNDNTSLYDVVFQSNSAAEEGGALFLTYLHSMLPPSFTVSGCTLKGNTAGANGGGIYADSQCKLFLIDTCITDNTAGKNGGGLFCRKTATAACDPLISGLITVTGNFGGDGKQNNVFLQENTTSKCLLIVDNGNTLDPASRIGISSNTNDGDLDVVRFETGDNWDACRSVFSYDNSDYNIHFYAPWYSSYWWVEIEK